MRKVLGIGFIILILFNTVGYMYVLDWCQGELQRKAEELIDTHASEISGNLIFTFPIHMPDAMTATEYKRIDGEIRFEGSVYRMVKEKVQGTLLYIVCVKDERTAIATEEINEIIAAVSGQPVKSTTSGAKIFNSLLKYCLTKEPNNCVSYGWSRSTSFVDYEDLYRYNERRAPFHPPSLI